MRFPRILSPAVAPVAAALLLAIGCGATPTIGDDISPTVAATPPTTTRPTTRPSAFDPARHMRVSEVRVGMTGYGLSVFRGTTLERFEVEVLAVLKNFNPKYDVVLITCHGANLEHTGAIAGMSGSPIYLKDDAGNHRMIGAFAYGWPLTKDPLAGVQPIEYMLDIDTTPRPVGGPAGESPKVASADAPAPRWTYTDAYPFHPPGPSRVRPAQLNNTNRPALTQLATPLMTAGLPPALARDLSPYFEQYGLVPLQAGGSGSARPTTRPAELVPGAAMAVPLLTGDVDFTAVGTVTEVLGDRVWGFGHPFNNEGPVALPMGVGEIAAVVPNLQTSFKLGTLTQLKGTVTADETVGIGGEVGATPPTIPIELHITYADGTLDKTYRFQSAQHPKFTPLLAAAALGSSIMGSRDLPPYHTLDYDLTMEFADGHAIRTKNRAANVGPMGLLGEVGVPITAALDNPFQRVPLKRLSGTVNVTPTAREAQILSINVPRLKVRPGETVKAYVTYRPFRAAEATMPVTFELPRDLPEGTYALVVADWQRYLQDEIAAKPFQFSADQIRDVFAVLSYAAGIRRDALYVRLVRQADGVAVGRVAMPRLPSSVRQTLLGSGRSNVTPFVSSTVKRVPCEYVMAGSADFEIVIDKAAKVEGPARPAEGGGTKPPEAQPKPPRVEPPSNKPVEAPRPTDQPSEATPPAADSPR